MKNVLIPFLNDFYKFLFSLNITTATFFVVLALLVPIYYAVGKKQRWLVLALYNFLFLAASCYGTRTRLIMFSFTACLVLAAWGMSLAMAKTKRKAAKRLLLAACVGAVLAAIALSKRKMAQGFLPMGLSYWGLSLVLYGFQVYKGTCRAEKNPLRLFAGLLFFPLLVSGPIVSYGKLKGSLFAAENPDFAKLRGGVERIIWGLFKKIAVSARAGIIVNTIFNIPGEYPGLYVLVGAFFYFIQLYTDFSGCIDIVIGSARLFGIDLPENFNAPFLANSVAEFWRRWHITLGEWLKECVYIPLGGNRKGALRKYANICAVFAVSGLWHGFAFKYLAWGLLHGFYQIAGAATLPLREKICQKLKINRGGFWFGVYQKIVVFVLVCFSWIFFRAESLQDALMRIASIFTDFNPRIFSGGLFVGLGVGIKFLACALFVLVAAALAKRYCSDKAIKVPVAVRCAFCWLLVAFIALSMNLSTQEFLYQQF